MQDHWDKVYTSKNIESLGWYQDVPQPDLDLIISLGLDSNSHIFIAGAGATTLVDHLLEYTNLTLVDISSTALNLLKQHLPPTSYRWLVDDLSQPRNLADLPPVDLWYDRAVLHFLTDETARNHYFSTLQQLVKPGGYVLLAEFSEEGAEKCSGLPVHRYSTNQFQESLGDDFQLVKTVKHLYIQPSGGQRPFIYAIFQRQ